MWRLHSNLLNLHAPDVYSAVAILKKTIHAFLFFQLFLKLLTRSRTVISQVIGSLHEDLHDDLAKKSLEYMAACYMRLLPPVERTADGAALITQKRRSGKVHRVVRACMRMCVCVCVLGVSTCVCQRSQNDGAIRNFIGKRYNLISPA